ncbi:MAG TPA: YlcI/YnfO family protein [Mycobacteriales bacterium]|nr:YlcI/YnfO family protein [Mycobacteriales bacterium]
MRFPPETLDEIRRRATEEDRSVSSWIRRAVEHELGKRAG